jgi:hypothetical protein
MTEAARSFLFRGEDPGIESRLIAIPAGEIRRGRSERGERWTQGNLVDFLRAAPITS